MNNRVIFEGWTVQDFIDHLEPLFADRSDTANFFYTTSFENREDIKKWCMHNQPFCGKYIKEVVDYFVKRAKL